MFPIQAYHYMGWIGSDMRERAIGLINDLCDQADQAVLAVRATGCAPTERSIGHYNRLSETEKLRTLREAHTQLIVAIEHVKI